MIKTLVSFGANVAEPDADLAAVFDKVLELLDSSPELTQGAVSRLYRTPAWPRGSGPDFINAALEIASGLGMDGILAQLHNVETQLGRERPVRWGPRVCDLDLLACGAKIRPDRETVEHWMALSDAEAIRRLPEELLLPHPRLHRRGFVLLPLAEIAPGWRHPILGRTVAEMVAALPPEATEGVTALG